MTKTELIREITEKNGADYEVWWYVFTIAVPEYMYYRHPTTGKNASELIETWLKETSTTPAVTVHEISNEYDGSWYHSRYAVYLNGVLNGVLIQRYKYDDEMHWRNEVAGIETLYAMFTMFREAVKHAVPQSTDEGEEWLHMFTIKEE